jgi:membrane-associated phospholipid phosphatase
MSAAAVTLFALFLILGSGVRAHSLGNLDARAAVLRAQATRLALFFTMCGRSVPLAMGYTVAVGVYALARLPIWLPLTLAASQIVSQMIVELFKALYRRTRPDYWLAGLEAGHSYPSGHATTAMVTFASWAWIAAASSLTPPLRIGIAALLAAWALGIMWSRLALGAHYLSDVAGGALFGGAWLCALAGAVTRLPH